MGDALSCHYQQDFLDEPERDERVQKLVEDLRLQDLNIKRETWDDDAQSKRKQMIRDFGRFVTHIQSTTFNPVQEEELETNFTTIQNLIRKHLQVYLGLTKKLDLDDAVSMILDSLFNTIRRGEIWSAVYNRCEDFPKIHALPTASGIPTKVEFVSRKEVVAQIGTSIEIWEEDENCENEIVFAVTCCTKTTFNKKKGKLGPPKVKYEVRIRYFSEEEKRERMRRVNSTGSM